MVDELCLNDRNHLQLQITQREESSHGNNRGLNTQIKLKLLAFASEHILPCINTQSPIALGLFHLSYDSKDTISELP